MEQEWISLEDRKPERSDADEYGCVLVWHLLQGVMLTGWRNAGNGMYQTHWMPTPPPPQGMKERRGYIEEMILNGNKK